ncbi:phosphodiesterase I [Malassezia sp. CBS 17886]|nr:phosphodiesterase I [Malassezia sp. CBS 17886]
MPLHLAHHKSYHPYKRDNIERVRRDEERARQEEEHAEQRMAAADRESRIDLLRRQRDGPVDGSDAQAGDAHSRAAAPHNAAPSAPSITTKDGHINFWSDLESGARSAPEAPAAKPPRGQLNNYTRRSAVELQPWYSSADLRNGREQDKPEDQQQEESYRDTTRKSVHDPLKAMSAHLEEKRRIQRGASASRWLPHAAAEREMMHGPAAAHCRTDECEVHTPISRRTRAPINRTFFAPGLAPSAKHESTHPPRAPTPTAHTTDGTGGTTTGASPHGDARGPSGAPAPDAPTEPLHVRSARPEEQGVAPRARYGRESMYVELLQEMICTVLENENHLFSPREVACLENFFLLECRKRHRWYRLDRIAFDDILDVAGAAHALTRPFAAPRTCAESAAVSEWHSLTFAADDELYRYTMMDHEMESGMEGRLQLLTLDELKLVARRLGVVRGTRRAEVVQSLLTKPTNATLLARRDATDGPQELRLSFSPAHMERLEQELIRIMAGGCICVVPHVAALVDRVGLVYYRGKPAVGTTPLTAMVLSRSRRFRFPEYEYRRGGDLFAWRSQLLRFELALQREEEIDGLLDELRTRREAAHEGVALLDTIWPWWKQSLRDTDAAFPHGVPHDRYHRMRFHPGWVLTRAVFRASGFLARLALFDREEKVLLALLQQRHFGRGRRGEWYDRLALVVSTHVSRAKGDDARAAKREALSHCVAALQDPDTHIVYVYALQRRIERLESQLRTPRAQRHSFGHNQLRASSEVVILGHRAAAPVAASRRPGAQLGLTLDGQIPEPVDADTMPCGPTLPTGVRSWWRGQDGRDCRVEELCLQHYARQGFHGYHCEGSVVLFLFTLLLWDVLFLPIEGAFETPYQRGPMDLPTDVFCIARREELAARLAEIERTGGLAILQAVDMRERPLRTHAVACRWDDIPTAALVEIAECLGGKVLAFLCRVLAEEWNMRTSGFPDLLLWRYADRQVRFVEVKGPGDRLSEKQKVWIDTLLRAGVGVELARVRDTSDPEKPATRNRT